MLTEVCVSELRGNRCKHVLFSKQKASQLSCVQFSLCEHFFNVQCWSLAMFQWNILVF